MKRPSDFSSGTIQLLGRRVAFVCSRANCRRRTIGPHSSDSQVTVIGEAAHICAASPGGARYDVSMSDEERGSHDNGIWLCANCATEIDKDQSRFPVSLLRQWKEDAELEALNLLENPAYRNHRQHKEQLARFLLEAQQLRGRLSESSLPIADHNAWVDRVDVYLVEQFGQSHKVRFSDFSGMVFWGGDSDRFRMERSLDGRSRCLHEFLSELGD